MKTIKNRILWHYDAILQGENLYDYVTILWDCIKIELGIYKG